MPQIILGVNLCREHLIIAIKHIDHKGMLGRDILNFQFKVNDIFHTPNMR